MLVGGKCKRDGHYCWMKYILFHFAFDLLLPQFNGVGCLHASRDACQTGWCHQSLSWCHKTTLINLISKIFTIVILFFWWFFRFRFQFSPHVSIDVTLFDAALQTTETEIFSLQYDLIAMMRFNLRLDPINSFRTHRRTKVFLFHRPAAYPSHQHDNQMMCHLEWAHWDRVS